MKKTLLFAGLLLGTMFAGNAQTTTIFEENFELNTALTGWTLRNLDGLTPNGNYATVFGTNAWAVVTWNSEPGNKVASTTSWFNPAGQANRWLITPQITLPANSQIQVAFKAKSGDSDPTYQDGYSLLVSTTGTNAADFTNVIYNTASEANTWQNRSYSLSQFAGQNIYIAWRNNNNDKNLLSIDDVAVLAMTTASTDDFLASKFTVFPNPANDVVNVANNGNVLVDAIAINDINGRTVKTVKLDAVSEAQVNIADLNSGVYFMNITTNEGVATKKIIKK
ncbi:T9SS-dependent choice-of-anchor J family protein [Flavobacterium cerinum]|uniref:Choice-of-anchor J domain-containing protein n=1 Tax=Flavobacterium cerinum TaxID=2502784 RepID=A0ABY5IQS5_9FLAO|nr:choice-of-anchor J domain-containing protein [Flavobacterium cerinum]UUC44984.1 choice-of-anchor J domain-containing protein [Flavobacterium cerinum]